MEGPILLRAGLLTPREYLEALAEEWGRYVERPGRNVTPLSELSFEAWVKQYKPSDNQHNRTVSYYEKGKWAALALELALREATAGRRGVVDLFRRLWRRFGAREVGLTEAELRGVVDEIAGRSMASYFARYVDGVAELPIPRLLARAGIEVVARRPEDLEDDPIKRRRARSWTGITFAPGSGDRAVVKTVVPGSPAWTAGLTYGDELVAVDGARVTSATAARRFGDHRPSERVTVSYFRRDSLRDTVVQIGSNPERRFSFRPAARAPAQTRAIRRAWIAV
jgi:predicted metalloprotease with PDZ domain